LILPKIRYNQNIFNPILFDTQSWSTVKIDRNGLQFFWRHVLNRDWQWVNIIKPPKIHTIPDILTPAEIEQLIGKTRKLRYRVFLLTTYSMGLRLEEALSLQVGDIDAGRKRGFISVAAKGIKIDWCHCRISRYWDCAHSGVSIVIQS